VRARTPRRIALAAVLVSGLLVGSCSGGDGGGSGGSPATVDDPGRREVLDPTGITAAQLAGLDRCEDLHAVVLGWLDAAAARASDLLGDGNALDLLVESVLHEGGPLEGLEAAEQLQPRRPYGGIAGSAAVARYEDLECGPEDEAPALLAWFGLPEDSPTSLEPGGPLAHAFTEHLASDGAGGFVAVGLARRLGEGLTPDPR
jgi:hypothetical protein